MNNCAFFRIMNLDYEHLVDLQLIIVILSQNYNFSLLRRCGTVFVSKRSILIPELREHSLIFLSKSADKNKNLQIKRNNL